MKIWKILLILTTIVLVAGYLIFALFFVVNKADETVCDGILVEISDSDERNLVTESNIRQLLTKNYPTIVGQKMEKIDLEKVEKIAISNPMVKKVACYKTQNGKIKIDIEQRQPIFKVMTSEGNFLVDTEKKIIKNSSNSAVYIPIVTGFVEKKFLEEQLYNFVVYLQNDRFYESQIEQIHVCKNREIELVPRVGHHIVCLGTLENYEEKLERLKIFYEKGMPQMGWDTYSKISLKYSNQIVCTKVQN